MSSRSRSKKSSKPTTTREPDRFPSGSENEPSISFNRSKNTGLYFNKDEESQGIGMSIKGQHTMLFTENDMISDINIVTNENYCVALGDNGDIPSVQTYGFRGDIRGAKGDEIDIIEFEFQEEGDIVVHIEGYFAEGDDLQYINHRCQLDFCDGELTYITRDDQEHDFGEADNSLFYRLRKSTNDEAIFCGKITVFNLGTSCAVSFLHWADDETDTDETEVDE